VRSRTLTCITAMTLFAALAIPLRMCAQEQNNRKELAHYTVTDLGTLGGTFSESDGISNTGAAAGNSTPPGTLSYMRLFGSTM
jgi:hypothetical protein